MPADEAEQLGPVAGLSDHLEAGALEQAGDSLAQKHVIVRQNHPWRAHSPEEVFHVPGVVLVTIRAAVQVTV